MWHRLKYHPLVIRLTNWEYWPMQIANIPVVVFWMLQAIRAGHPMFFTRVNPTISTGGMFGESKRDIFKSIPRQHLPASIYIDPDTVDISGVLKALDDADVVFPLIAKPDIGERGFRVEKIAHAEALNTYLSRFKAPVVLQEMITYPLELSILCYKMPTGSEAAVTSVCRKEFLSVRGDGRSSVGELIQENPRAILQRQRLSQRISLEYVPGRAETVELEQIGNHCLGTKFVDARGLLDDRLERTVLGILRQMPDLHYGRFDLRAKSIEDLREGKNFKILEFNGVASEPAHIYDPAVSLLKAYGCLWRHWNIMRRIAAEQRRKGVRAMTFVDALRALRRYFGYKKQARLALSGA